MKLKGVAAFVLLSRDAYGLVTPFFYWEHPAVRSISENASSIVLPVIFDWDSPGFEESHVAVTAIHIFPCKLLPHEFRNGVNRNKLSNWATNHNVFQQFLRIPLTAQPMKYISRHSPKLMTLNCTVDPQQLQHTSEDHTMTVALELTWRSRFQRTIVYPVKSDFLAGENNHADLTLPLKQQLRFHILLDLLAHIPLRKQISRTIGCVAGHLCNAADTALLTTYRAASYVPFSAAIAKSSRWVADSAAEILWPAKIGSLSVVHPVSLSAEQAAERCPICQMELGCSLDDNGEPCELIVQSKCAQRGHCRHHRFHQSCFDELKQKSSTKGNNKHIVSCPMCRTELDLDTLW